MGSLVNMTNGDGVENRSGGQSHSAAHPSLSFFLVIGFEKIQSLRIREKERSGRLKKRTNMTEVIPTSSAKEKCEKAIS